MSKYIKKNKGFLAGVLIPSLMVAALVVIGLHVMPGWINVSYGVPGTPCSTPGDPICEVCNRESCIFNSITSTSQCADANGSFTAPAGETPACPNFNGFPNTIPVVLPGCFSACEEVPNTPFPPEVAECIPDNGFCQDLVSDNNCRSGTCTTSAIFDSTNPSGCDYVAIPESQNPECIVCEDNTEPPGYSTCGNGVCEPGATPSEDCTSCPEDCLVPGFEDTCPLASDDPIFTQGACETITITFVTFTGPPYNLDFSGICEDGEVCTLNQCEANETCSASDLGCVADEADFCCPAGCNPPSSGSCSGVTNCDLDCITPQDCSEEPIPSATPIVTGHNLEGSGISCSNSLIPDGNQSAMLATLLAVSAAIGVALSLRLRKH